MLEAFIMLILCFVPFKALIFLQSTFLELNKKLTTSDIEEKKAKMLY
jgi:hypothetical protein